MEKEEEWRRQTGDTGIQKKADREAGRQKGSDDEMRVIKGKKRGREKECKG